MPPLISSDIDEIAASYETKLAAAIFKTCTRQRDAVTVAQCRKAITSGDSDALIEAASVDVADIKKAADDVPTWIERVLIDLHTDGYDSALEEARMHVSFTLVNEFAVDYALKESAKLVGYINDATRDSIRLMLSFAQQGYMTVDQLARTIRYGIGLTPRQAQATTNYVKALYQAMDEGRSASWVRAQYKLSTLRGSVTSEAQIEKLAQRYAERQLAWRATNIARTETMYSANHGQWQLWQQMVDEGMMSSSTTTMGWITAGDERMCDQCAPMSGVEVPIRESFHSVERGVPGAELAAYDGPIVDHPPLHPQCVIGSTIVDAPGVAVAATSRWWSAKAFEIRVSGGAVLTATPNHPVLTLRGWVPAGLLVKGDQVVTASRRERQHVGDPDEHEMPARIEDVFAASRDSVGVSSASVPVSDVDFHGDRGDADVDVVWPDGSLRDGTKRGEHVDDALLGCGRHECVLSHESDLAAVLDAVRASASGVMRCGCVGSTLLGRAARLFETVGFSDRATCDIPSSQSSGDHVAADAVVVSDDVLRHARQIATDDDETVCVDSSSSVAGFADTSRCRAIESDTPLRDPRMGGRSRDAVFTSESVHSRVAVVEPCRDEFAVSVESVVAVRPVRLAAHVFNLETSGGWYAANGIVTHNCRCTTWLNVRWDEVKAPVV